MDRYLIHRNKSTFGKIDTNFNVVNNVIDKDLAPNELEQMANLIFEAYKNGKSYQYIRKDNKYGILRLKAIKEIKIKKI